MPIHVPRFTVTASQQHPMETGWRSKNKNIFMYTNKLRCLLDGNTRTCKHISVTTFTGGSNPGSVHVKSWCLCCVVCGACLCYWAVSVHVKTWCLCVVVSGGGDASVTVSLCCRLWWGGCLCYLAVSVHVKSWCLWCLPLLVGV